MKIVGKKKALQILQGFFSLKYVNEVD